MSTKLDERLRVGLEAIAEGIHSTAPEWALDGTNPRARQPTRPRRWRPAIVAFVAVILGTAMTLVAVQLVARDERVVNRPAAQSTPSCSTILAAGRTTPDLVHPPRCLGPDGKPDSIGESSWACKNRNPVFGNEYGDRRLFANEYGYGVGGEPWHTDAKDGDYDPASPLGRAIAVCEGRATS